MNGITLGTLAFVFTAVGTGAPVVGVPSPVNKEAVFEVGKSTTEKPGRSGEIVASSVDGARIVVAEAALITATHGSKISYIESLETGQVRVVLESGGFICHVGSSPVVFALGGFELEVKSARVAISRERNVWFVESQDQFSAAKPVIRYTIANPDISLESAVEPTVSKSLEMEKKKTLKLEAGKDPVIHPTEDYWSSLVQRLEEPKQTIVLEPHDIEDPKDIMTQLAVGEGDMTEIEIEAVEIEIEADCIEICVD